MQKFFHAQQIEQLRNSPSARRAFLIAVPIAVLVTISYILDPGRKMMLALCLLYSVFIVPKATKGVITKLTHVYVFTVVTFPFVAIAEYFQSGDTLMIGYLMVFAVLNYEYGQRKWMDELAAARKARKRGQ
ncbi:hypothetical protein [Rhizobium chutanense]|uniref:Uncharacterized protein n=1 Tax=Rhizobium chutanense TaxID=2035448 RepID=A0A3S0SJB0_9HYPH|nr:hypothetical protein [Rhizobium chutanense]RUM07987.1 hypothetical protein EFR84_07735 [Rhizobium chutanense]